ncbi:MAG: hypothetical protein JRN66_04050 [Nitrososphaerota archaeon]|nr:hypothetical protein [Nitrososphaerota archaeon]
MKRTYSFEEGGKCFNAQIVGEPTWSHAPHRPPASAKGLVALIALGVEPFYRMEGTRM